jgi:hypothetical protein
VIHPNALEAAIGLQRRVLHNNSCSESQHDQKREAQAAGDKAKIGSECGTRFTGLFSPPIATEPTQWLPAWIIMHGLASHINQHTDQSQHRPGNDTAQSGKPAKMLTKHRLGFDVLCKQHNMEDEHIMRCQNTTRERNSGNVGVTR